MDDRLFTRYYTASYSSSTDIADSGITSRLTPRSSINEHRLNIHVDDDNDDDDDDGGNSDIVTTERIRSLPVFSSARDKRMSLITID